MNNSFGELFRITLFGESHGSCAGVVVDGCPAGLLLSERDIQSEVDKRKPVPQAGQTPRREEDQVQILAGVFKGRTTGAPICLLVWNKDTDSSAYEKIKNTPRPGHADYTAFVKYGGLNDYRGGGRFSGRVTVGLVMAGAVAKNVLNLKAIEVLAHTVQLGSIKAGESTYWQIRSRTYKNSLRCADAKVVKLMLEELIKAEREGNSLGGVVEGIALNLPVGLGEPFFDTLEGQLAKALFAIPAVKGVEFGAGFRAAEMKGSENNDPLKIEDGRIVMGSNNAGGVLGGISDGMPLILRAAVKPTPSIAQNQQSVNLETMKETRMTIKGRHDVCLAPRAVVIVESMMAVTLCDLALRAGLIERIVK
jgi:chorismate synthase